MEKNRYGVLISKNKFHICLTKREKPDPVLGQASVCGVAATYFPAVPRSIIGAAGLNFSVRNGKRWTSAL